MVTQYQKWITRNTLYNVILKYSKIVNKDQIDQCLVISSLFQYWQTGYLQDLYIT